MVENNRGTYEFAYAPTGTQPLAWLQGQRLAGTHLPLASVLNFRRKQRGGLVEGLKVCPCLGNPTC
jgi:hypothetical protein